MVQRRAVTMILCICSLSLGIVFKDYSIIQAMLVSAILGLNYAELTT